MRVEKSFRASEIIQTNYGPKTRNPLVHEAQFGTPGYRSPNARQEFPTYKGYQFSDVRFMSEEPSSTNPLSIQEGVERRRKERTKLSPDQIMRQIKKDNEKRMKTDRKSVV